MCGRTSACFFADQFAAPLSMRMLYNSIQRSVDVRYAYKLTLVFVVIFNDV